MKQHDRRLKKDAVVLLTNYSVNFLEILTRSMRNWRHTAISVTKIRRETCQCFSWFNGS